MKSPAVTTEALRVHHFLPASRANGPGLRAVLWVQGCALGCPGCFNPNSHAFDAGELIPVETMASRILSLTDTIEGLTISGGEPFHQHHALTQLLQTIRSKKDLSVVVFSGYRLDEIQHQHIDSPLPYIDVLIAGRYQAGNRIASGLIGSSNKTVHFFTPRYTPADLVSVPETEVLIAPDGEIILSGINPLSW